MTTDAGDSVSSDSGVLQAAVVPTRHRPLTEVIQCIGPTCDTPSDDEILPSPFVVQEASVVGGGNRDGMGSQSVA
jgi:hypothetical protein